MLFRMLRIVGKRVQNVNFALRCFSSLDCDPPIAVVLSGCGGLDGSEVHEAAFLVKSITRHRALPFMFAPTVKQREVVDHSTGQPVSVPREVDVESARIARGPVKPLSELVDNFKNFSAVVFPGGKGVVNVLSDFASKGRDCTVHPDVVSIIRSCHASGIPLGFCCIAPVLAARILCNPLITLGNTTPASAWPYSVVVNEAMAMGASVELRNVNEITVDQVNKLYSTPCFMYKCAKYHEVDDAIGKMVQSIVSYITHRK